MSYIRVRKSKENPYTMIHNKILDDEQLTWKAKGILGYLLRLPDDWQIYEEEISKHAADGLKSLKSGIKELIKFGYIVRSQMRDDKGRFIGYDYCIHEFPSESIKTVNGESVDGFSVNGKRPATNTNLPSTNSTNTYEDEEVLKAYKEIKGRYLNSREKDLIREILKSHSKDLILKAIDIMVTDAEKITLKYVISTLEDWKTKGIQTVEEVNKMRLEWSETKRKAKKNKQKIVRSKTGEKPSNFNNFKNRDYDFDKLERQLLGWDKEA